MFGSICFAKQKIYSKEWQEKYINLKKKTQLLIDFHLKTIIEPSIVNTNFKLKQSFSQSSIII